MSDDEEEEDADLAARLRRSAEEDPDGEERDAALEEVAELTPKAAGQHAPAVTDLLQDEDVRGAVAFFCVVCCVCAYSSRCV